MTCDIQHEFQMPEIAEMLPVLPVKVSIAELHNFGRSSKRGLNSDEIQFWNRRIHPVAVWNSLSVV
jgi:hypothetical protein